MSFRTISMSFLQSSPDGGTTAADSLALAQQVANNAKVLCDASQNDHLGFWEKVYWCHPLYDWALFLAVVAGTFLFAKLLYWLSGKILKKATAKTKTKLDDILVDMLEEPIVLIVVGLGLYYAYERFLNYSPTHPEVHEFIGASFGAFFTLATTWAIARTVDALVEEYIVPLAEKSENELDDQFLPIIRKTLRVIIWILGIIIALQNAGFNITALIASLGVGGLALALAAQDTVKNLIGGVMIFADKPFRLKDRIKISGYDGVVEEIGIRSTRVRTLEGRLLTIPNATFSDSIIENVSSEPRRKVVLNIGLTYDMQPEQIQQAIDILQEVGHNHDSIEEDVLTSFNAFGDFSLGILFIYYIKEGGDILQTQTDVNLAVLSRFNSAGLDMAFPTQTVYTIPPATGTPEGKA